MAWMECPHCRAKVQVVRRRDAQVVVRPATPYDGPRYVIFEGSFQRHTCGDETLPSLNSRSDGR